MNDLMGPVAEIARLWLLVALLVAAWGKSFHFGQFRRDLAKSFPGLRPYVVPVGAAIIVAEWGSAALVVLGGPFARYGLIATLALFIVFTTVIAVSLAQDRTVLCSCFGGSSHRISAYDLVRNLLFIGAAGFALGTPSLPADDVFLRVMLAGVAVIFFLISTALQDIVAVLRIKV
ncbi:MauE/DoxX family redox-associated membrane protein [Tahibacter amnicola]|uniref:Methylamine utilization protein MauE n=1 Tax=Tahibacter amnicola TaxID=2976241 RepID=A0ABY6BD28_9GAMM|nr:MauE/DoxX family redox-associated membrane protein [Tahibacter amnicola]UXI66235.1 hypothetical protein N4264_15920 [Tahibacter amnicola]